MMFRNKGWMVALGLSAVLAGLPGCTMDPQVKSTKGQVNEKKDLVRSMTQVHDELLKANLEIQRSISAMDDFTRTNDLNRAYAMFNDSVTELKRHAQHATDRGAEMRARRAEYLQRWQDEIATMDNPELKEGLAARQQRIRDNFDRITGIADEVRAAYTPYISNLEQIQRALKLDLTPAGVQAIKPAVDSAKRDAEALSKKLDQLGVEVDALTGKIAPTPTPTPPPPPAAR